MINKLSRLNMSKIWYYCTLNIFMKFDKFDNFIKMNKLIKTKVIIDGEN